MSLDVLKTSKYVWEEMKKLGFKLSVKDSVKLARKNNELSGLTQESTDLIQRLREDLIHVGKLYIVRCPKCGIEYKLGISELNMWEPVECQNCGEKYQQTSNIKLVVCEADKLNEMVYACSRFLRKVEDICD